MSSIVNNRSEIYKSFEPIFYQHMKNICDQDFDPSHDILHVDRVVKNAKQLAISENADLNIVVPAAYLHDCILIPKSDPRRKMASTLSAEKAIDLLKNWGYPEQYFQEIFHAIQSHSFSANIHASTLEAKVVQDADRLDAMGLIGVLRCFSYSGILKRPFYASEDPFCSQREANDSEFTLDHFYVKLFKLHERLNTQAARREGELRLLRMKSFIEQFKFEIE